MRQIKFKAKRIDNGEWVSGFYHEQELLTGVAEPRTRKYYFIDGINVDPATVCEFTGLKDKNGEEIYEGDILESSFPNRGDIPNRIQLVEWSDRDAGFIARDYPTEFRITGKLHPMWWDSNCKIIGNKFDNPELLEAK